MLPGQWGPSLGLGKIAKQVGMVLSHCLTLKSSSGGGSASPDLEGRRKHVRKDWRTRTETACTH